MEGYGIKLYKQLHMEEYGEDGCCLACGSTSNPYKAPHHILSRGRYPKHAELHNHLNLIMLCQECHKEADRHEHWSEYDRLVEERDLIKLFN